MDDCLYFLSHYDHSTLDILKINKSITQLLLFCKILLITMSIVAGYLGMLINGDTDDNDTITLHRQSDLAQRIIEALHLDDNT